MNGSGSQDPNWLVWYVLAWQYQKNINALRSSDIIALHSSDVNTLYTECMHTELIVAM